MTYTTTDESLKKSLDRTVRTRVAQTEAGISDNFALPLVTETSDDPNMVAVIREHAREVTQFVTQGMSAMMNGRMR